MEKQRKTFLSYSRVNKDFAVRLAKELKSEGFDIWLDQLDIPAGARWDREVEQALEDSEIFMIILTAAAINSENVLDEIGFAIDNSKRILPVLLENCKVPLRLRRFQYVDFTNKDFDDGVESAKALLRGLIDQPTIPRIDAPAVSDVTAAEERKSKEEAEHLAAKKAEQERLAKQKVAAEHKIQEETELSTAQQADEERLAQVKTENERQGREMATPSEAKIGPGPLVPAQKTRISKVSIPYIIVAVVVLTAVGIVFRMLANANKFAPAPTSTNQTEVLPPTFTNIATATAAQEKTIVGQWIRRSADMTEYLSLDINGSFHIEARNNESDSVITSADGTYTYNEINIFWDSPSFTVTESYYLDNGGDLLVINDQIDQAWTRIE